MEKRRRCTIAGITVLKSCLNETQAHILNLPVGNNISMTAKGSLKLDGVKLKLGDKKARWKSLVGILLQCTP